ncbi:hypothetical protein ES707_06740 [subsurface metagenome]
MGFNVTYRKLAITMVKHFPVANEEEFISKVEYYTDFMNRLPRICQSSLKAAYIIASKSRPEEREDYFQEFYLAAHKALTRAHTKYKVINDDALAMTAVKGKRRDIWHYLKALKRNPDGGFISLSHSFPDEAGRQIELGETISDGIDFTKSIESAEDEKRIWELLTPEIKHIVLKRLNHQRVAPSERKKLSRWNQVNGNKILEIIK